MEALGEAIVGLVAAQIPLERRQPGVGAYQRQRDAGDGGGVFQHPAVTL